MIKYLKIFRKRIWTLLKKIKEIKYIIVIIRHVKGSKRRRTRSSKITQFHRKTIL